MKAIFIIIGCIIISSCASRDVMNENTVRDAKLKESQKHLDELVEDMDEDIEVDNKNRNSNNYNNLDISPCVNEKEIKMDEEKYRYGESEGDDYNNVYLEAKEDLIKKIVSIIISKTKGKTLEHNETIDEEYSKEIESNSRLKIFNLKTCKVKPKYGKRYRVLCYIAQNDLDKSTDDLEKEVSGILKNAESTELLNNSIFESIPMYLNAYQKSMFSYRTINYNSNNKGQINAYEFAKERINTGLQEINVDSCKADIMESDSIIIFTFFVTQFGKKASNTAIRIQYPDNSVGTPQEIVNGYCTIKVPFDNIFPLTNRILILQVSLLPLSKEISSYWISEFQNTRELKIDFSSYVSIDFNVTVLNSNSNTYQFHSIIKGISVLQDSWEWKFWDNEISKSNDMNPIKRFSGLHESYIIELKINNNTEYRIRKKMKKNGKIETITLDSILTDSRVSESVSNIFDKSSVNQNKIFENMVSNINSGIELNQLIEENKMKGFLIYSKNAMAFTDIESCYLIISDANKHLGVLRPGKKKRLNIYTNKEINIDSHINILYYVKLTH